MVESCFICELQTKWTTKMRLSWEKMTMSFAWLQHWPELGKLSQVDAAGENLCVHFFAIKITQRQLFALFYVNPFFGEHSSIYRWTMQQLLLLLLRNKKTWWYHNNRDDILTQWRRRWRRLQRCDGLHDHLYDNPIDILHIFLSSSSLQVISRIWIIKLILNDKIAWATVETLGLGGEWSQVCSLFCSIFSCKDSSWSINNNNNNNNSFYFRKVIGSTWLTQFTCNRAFSCFLSYLALSLSFLWRKGIELFLNLSVLAWWTKYFSLFLILIVESFKWGVLLNSLCRTDRHYCDTLNSCRSQK